MCDQPGRLAGGTLGDGDGNGTVSALGRADRRSLGHPLLRGDRATWDSGDNFYIDNFTVNATMPGLNAGVDTINGDAGDDTIIWNANAAAPTDGRDIVNGGTEGAAGDTFVINGNASAEMVPHLHQGGGDAAAGIDLGGGDRNRRHPRLAAGGPLRSHRRTHRDRGNPHQRRRSVGHRRDRGSGDTFAVIGDFSTTSLRLNTITIDGDAGDDTIDISALTSAHRIVFRSNGGNDTIIGALRPEDVIELPDGATLADYTSQHRQMASPR